MTAHDLVKTYPKMKDLTSLKDIISGLLNDPNLPFNPEDRKVFEVWEEAVGSLITKQARPAWIEKGKLRVIVSDSIWLQELEFAKDIILKKINSKLGKKAVKKIEFRIGLR